MSPGLLALSFPLRFGDNDTGGADRGVGTIADGAADVRGSADEEDGADDAEGAGGDQGGQGQEAVMERGAVILFFR